MFKTHTLSLDGPRPAVVRGPDDVDHPVEEPGEHSQHSRQRQHRRRTRAWGEVACCWVQDRLPRRIQARVTIGGRELGLIALIAAAALCLAGSLALRASAGAVTLSPNPVQPVSAQPSAPTSSSPLVRAEAKTVVVDVTGEVTHPGVITLPAGSRVFEAVKAAGGAKPGANLTSLNQARVLVDGEQLAVGVEAASGIGPGRTNGAGGSLVSLNNATQADLETLPGVGPITAKSIIDWRTEHGSFTTVEELQEVDGIGPKTFAKLKAHVGL